MNNTWGSIQSEELVSPLYRLNHHCSSVHYVLVTQHNYFNFKYYLAYQVQTCCAHLLNHVLFHQKKI